MKVKPVVQEVSVKVTRILAPTDFSPGAEAAVRWAMALAKVFGAEVTLLHVMDLRIPAIADLPGEIAAVALPDVLEQVRTESTAQTKKLAAQFPGAKTLLREGIPRAIIIQVGGKIGADLIVMHARPDRVGPCALRECSRACRAAQQCSGPDGPGAGQVAEQEHERRGDDATARNDRTHRYLRAVRPAAGDSRTRTAGHHRHPAPLRRLLLG